MRRSKLYIFIVLFISFFAFTLPANASVNISSSKLNQNSSGLVGWWTLDGKDTNWATGVVSDKSGSGYNGQTVAMATSSAVAGKIGQALKFGGNANYVTPSTPVGVYDTTNGFTVSMWVKPEKATVGCPFGTINGNIRLYMLINSSLWQIGLGNTGNIATGLAVDVNKWQHVVLVLNGSNATFYKNAVADSAPDSYTPFSITLAPLIGRLGANSASDFTGSVDDVRVYNRALSATEVAQLYNTGAAKIGASNANTSTGGLNSGLVGYWTFDGKDTNWATGVVTDKSGSGYNGQATSIATSSAVAGKVGQGLYFPYSTSNTVGVNENINTILTGTHSISFWIKPTRGNTTLYYIGNNDGVHGGTHFYIYDNTFNLFVSTSGGIISNGTKISNKLNQWRLITLTRDSVTGLISLYQNGVLDKSTTGSTGSIDMSFGHDKTRIGQGCDCIIDDVRVYNRALSAMEITQLYNLGGNKSAVSSTATSTTGYNNGLVGKWTFDGKNTNWATGAVTDSSGAGNNGQIVAMATSSAVAGKVGQALSFDGVNDYIDVSNAAFNNLPATYNFTVSFWFKSEIFNTSSAAVTFEGTDDIVIYPNNSVIGPRIYWRNLGGNIISALSTQNRSWHHLVFTSRDSNDHVLYVDGIQVGNSTATGSVGPFSYLYIGKYPGQQYNGLIDDVRVYNRALSATEILQLYNDTK